MGDSRSPSRAPKKASGGSGTEWFLWRAHRPVAVAAASAIIGPIVPPALGCRYNHPIIILPRAFASKKELGREHSSGLFGPIYPEHTRNSTQGQEKHQQSPYATAGDCPRFEKNWAPSYPPRPTPAVRIGLHTTELQRCSLDMYEMQYSREIDMDIA